MVALGYEKECLMSVTFVFSERGVKMKFLVLQYRISFD